MKGVTLTPDSALVADLGLESVQIIEFLCEVEDHFDIVIGEDSLADVVTVSDLAELVYHLLWGKRIMSLLSNFELAERRKRQLEGLRQILQE